MSLLASLVKGKTVAVVGRAGSILGTGNGPAIDACDVVIRVNWLLPIPEEQVPDVGARTDLIYTCIRCATARKLAKKQGVPAVRLGAAARIDVTRKYFGTAKKLRGSTGLVCVWDCLTAKARRVHLYGFDLFRSEHFQERCPDGNSPLGSSRGKWLHDWELEERAWRRLLKRHPKTVRPDPIFLRALYPGRAE